MRVLKNILISLGLLALAIVVGAVINSAKPPEPGNSGAMGSLAWLMVIFTSAWAATVSYKMEFRKYKSEMSRHPVTIFLIHLLFWIIVFPWFLTVRDNIKDGSAELKEEFKHEVPPNDNYQASAARISSGGLAHEIPGTADLTPIQPAPTIVPPPLPPQAPKVSAQVPPPLAAVASIPPPLPVVAPVSQPMPPPLPRPQAAPAHDRFEQLQKLAQLKEQGILTDAEFQGEKQKILGQA